MDWKLCLICQEASNEGLKCPLNALGSGDMSAPYESFLSRVSIFKEFDRLPIPLNHFGDNTSLNDLVANKASWHKSCHFKFSQDRLERVRKRGRTEPEVVVNAKRACRPRTSFDKSTCIFCQECDGSLHEFRTLDVDTSIRSMAADLQDTALLTKIEGGDLIALEAKYHLACLINQIQKLSSIFFKRKANII